MIWRRSARAGHLRASFTPGGTTPVPSFWSFLILLRGGTAFAAPWRRRLLTEHRSARQTDQRQTKSTIGASCEPLHRCSWNRLLDLPRVSFVAGPSLRRRLHQQNCGVLRNEILAPRALHVCRSQFQIVIEFGIYEVRDPCRSLPPLRVRRLFLRPYFVPE